jgi:hypothetical protein
MAHRPVERSLVIAVPGRRFAPPTGFLCGACHLEVFAGQSELVWANGSRVPLPDVTLARALRLVARGTWVELRASQDKKTPHPRVAASCGGRCSRPTTPRATAAGTSRSSACARAGRS